MSTRWLVTLASWAILGYLLLPILVIMGTSFTSSSFLAFPPQGWSLDWYRQVLNDPSYMAAFTTSSLLALTATVIALLLSIPAALALARYEFFGKGALLAALSSPLVFPHIVLGAALLQFGGYFGLTRSFLALLIGHTIIISPFILRSVLPMFTPEQRTLEDASNDLGGTSWVTFFLVVLPRIRAGIISGSIFAFIASWINVELSIFNTTPALNTIPVKLFNYVQYSVDPTIAAACGATIGVVVIVIVLLDLFIGLDFLDTHK
ncbi:ABC transporter permease [Budvicia aquatica]|uniref:ABC transporter permease n=1 Tax=Budvicia aquatica TaxID=82979 RepID=A0A2C6DN08_9GAMM|nr:ABC transporter permease [Budvicia aquatica]PHI30083.1 ABC transporter permease [Budvicia aquatica]